MTTPTGYYDHDDADTITPEKAQLIALGFAEVRDHINRQITGQVAGNDLAGLTEAIRRSRRYDALVKLWDTYVVAAAQEAAEEAGRMIYRAVKRSEVDTDEVDAAHSFLGDIHEQYHDHARVLRHITHGIA